MNREYSSTVPGNPYATIKQRIDHLRDTYNMGMNDAKKIVRREDLIREINDAETIHDIKRILLEMI